MVKLGSQPIKKGGQGLPGYIHVYVYVCYIYSGIFGVRSVGPVGQISWTKIQSLKLTASLPLKIVVSNGNLLFQGSIFRGELLVPESSSRV